MAAADPGVTLPSPFSSKISQAAVRGHASCSPCPPPSLPRGDPAFRLEQEMKGRRPKRLPFNQIRLPLQAQAGNRPTN